jgi:hypothetical protein
MIAVDTNILVYCHRSDSEFHIQAEACLTELAESGVPWAIPYPCIHEFLAIATNPGIYRPPTPLDDAILQVECWLESPTLHLLAESGDYWACLRKAARAGKVSGGMIHDARIAALCCHHGVQELWTADRDFLRFPGIKVVNPLHSR